jgi:hypothetical protein
LLVRWLLVRETTVVSALPKALLALLLVLPGGFIVAPLLLLWLRWHNKREAAQGQSTQAQSAHPSTPAAVHSA